jgi:hypothetical protein
VICRSVRRYVVARGFCDPEPEGISVEIGDEALALFLTFDDVGKVQNKSATPRIHDTVKAPCFQQHAFSSGV